MLRSIDKQSLDYIVNEPRNPWLRSQWNNSPRPGRKTGIDRIISGMHGSTAEAFQVRLPPQTVVRDILYLPAARGEKRKARGELLDVSGRKVLDLKPGANDVRALAPGVYFVLEPPQAPSPKPQTVRRVVIAR